MTGSLAQDLRFARDDMRSLRARVLSFHDDYYQTGPENKLMNSEIIPV
jgi:hypothetical protein